MNQATLAQLIAAWVLIWCSLTHADTLCCCWLQALLSTTALERSAVASLYLPGQQIQAPFTELLDEVFGDSGTSASGLASAVVQLGQATAAEQQPIRSSIQSCVAAVMQHLKPAGRPQGGGAGPEDDSQAAALTKLENSIAELQLASAQPNSSLR